MNNRLALWIAALFIVGTAARAADADLERLKQSYQDASARALAPINATYEKELLKLLEQRTKAGQLAEAIEVKEEIERLTGRAIKDTSGSPIQPGKPPLEKLFVGKSWRTSLGTSFEFKKGGSGTRQLGSDKKAIVWRIVGPDMVEVSGQKNDSGVVETWFFKFLDKGEGYIGGSRDKIDGKLKPE
ncbi:hypothetical protein [Prosthecobacter sp.]|uniref:hypothetical protein n=1 Tax=Prosthecobacter sp. TaxID=1965333 RepID=UPI001DC7DE9B|nr:hypothetical protein [Prosthecobacter sp.]MCB1276173.1 hypothetical protein [Prosthecobacter sp.]